MKRSFEDTALVGMGSSSILWRRNRTDVTSYGIFRRMFWNINLEKKKTKGSLVPSSRRNLNTYVNEIKSFEKKKKIVYLIILENETRTLSIHD